MAHLTGSPDSDMWLANLTELERAAIVSGTNVADGHARYEPTPSQQKIIARLPELFEQAARTSDVALDRQAQAAYLSAVGQRSAVADAEVLSCYSSSVALEIFGRSLHAAGIRRVAVTHPTFDNIPDILRGVGMRLSPVSEEQVFDAPAGLPDEAEVLFVTTPNNPTGRVLSHEQLAHLAHRCAARGVILALDTSFRGFDPAAQYDHYEVLTGSGCRYVVIEDTGKLWPTLDLKVGMLAFGRTEPLPLHRIYTDVLLRVSPLILLLVQQFAEDAAAGGFADLHELVASNRGLLHSCLSGAAALSLPDPHSRISVVRVGLPAGLPATELCGTLRRRGVHVLPCRQFHWAEPEAGERFVRVALSRPPEVVATAAAALRRCVEAA